MLKILFQAFLSFFFICSLSAQDVGINTSNPIYTLDVRGTDDKSDGGEFQIATPSMTNFLRFFSGRTDDKNPFMAFNEIDTFHFVTTLPDFSTYNRRMTLFPDGKLGLGTDRPKAELDIRTIAVDDGTELHLSNSDASYFLRFFSGKPTNPRPSVFWNFESELDFAQFDGNLNYVPFLRLDGKRINVLNTNGSVLIGEDAGFSDEGSFNTAVGSFSMHNNVSGNRNTVLGYNAAGSGGGANSGNVLLGYQAGFNLVGSDRLYIENSSSTTPLIYGEFDNDLVRVNGRQEITGNLNLNQGISSGVALRINGQEALWSNGNYFSYGFGTGHNYFAKEVRVGPVEGSSTPMADLHVVDDDGAANVTIEAYNGDAILQLTGSTSDQNNHWTMRRVHPTGELQWKYSNTNRMVMTPIGNIAINKPTPQARLDVAGDAKFTTSLNTALTSSNDLYVMTIENTSNQNTFRNSGLEIQAGHDVISANGNSRSKFIGFTKPNGTLLGAISQLSNSSIIYYETSDARLKTEIRPTEIELETLMKISVRDYKWKDDTTYDSKTTGFIAQELFEVYPIAARRGGSDAAKDPWQIAPEKLIPLIVKSTQDQQKLIESLQSENENLLTRIERLESLLLKGE